VRCALPWQSAASRPIARRRSEIQATSPENPAVGAAPEASAPGHWAGSVSPAGWPTSTTPLIGGIQRLRGRRIEKPLHRGSARQPSSKGHYTGQAAKAVEQRHSIKGRALLGCPGHHSTASTGVDARGWLPIRRQHRVARGARAAGKRYRPNARIRAAGPWGRLRQSQQIEPHHHRDTATSAGMKPGILAA